MFSSLSFLLSVLSVSNVSVSVVESLTHAGAMTRNSTALVWNIIAPCRLEAEIHLCKKTSGSTSSKDCQVTDDLRNSRRYIHSRQHRKWNLNSKQQWVWIFFCNNPPPSNFNIILKKICVKDYVFQHYLKEKLCERCS